MPPAEITIVFWHRVRLGPDVGDAFDDRSQLVPTLGTSQPA
jgi:hypothetical protein